MSSNNDVSLKQLVGELRRDAALLARQELALVKATAQRKVVSYAVAGVLAYAGVLVVLAALVLLLTALGVVAWLSALLIGALVLVAALVIVQRARSGNESSHT